VFAFGDAAAKSLARDHFNEIVRTGTMLFQFVSYAEQLRGWGPSLRKAVAGWYEGKDAIGLSYQLVKYRQREGWTHRDVLRSAHPRAHDAEKKVLYDWTCGRPSVTPQGHAGFVGWTGPYEAAKILSEMTDAKAKKGAYADLIRAHPGMSWEMLPDEALTIPETWEALITAGMPITALIRQLPRLTNLGVFSTYLKGEVVKQLTDVDSLRKGRVHPVRLLYALKTYARGAGFQGRSTWTPNQRVVDALDAAFYVSFGTVEPAGKRTLIAQDVSGSMSWSGDGILTAAEGAVAMAMVTAATEPDYEIMGFANTFRRLDISPRRRLDDNLRTIANMTFGSTNCSLPMVWAKENKLSFDTFVVYTDNETYAGHIQPYEALRQYRQATGIDARLIVVGMTSTGFSIADPNDQKMLDVCGFDADTPSMISGFSRGDFG
jgi:60 kDa SS-A/Ro ribonucleoprotein